MPTDWIAFGEALLNGLGLVREAKTRRDDRADAAVMAVYTAAAETRRYLSALQRGKARDFDREHSLSHLWNIASIPLRHFDADLARRCLLKGDYWLDPDRWTISAIQSSGIALDRVFKEAQSIIFHR